MGITRVAHTRSGKPLPFILTVFPVVFYIVLIALGYYVYVVTLCVRIIQEGEKALGVVLIVLYHISFVLMVWAYFMVILTDPGKVSPEVNGHNPIDQELYIFRKTLLHKVTRYGAASVNMSWAHQMQIVGMVISGVFGITLVVFTITHLRLILLNRTTIEDHDTPREEGMLPCIRKKWVDGEGEINQGNERLYDVGFNQNWEQAMGKGWTCMIPVRFLRPEGPIYNQKVVARQWKDYNQQLEEQRQQQQQQLQQLQQVAIQQQQPQQPGQQPLQDQDQSIPAVVTARENSIDSEVHHRSNSIPQVQDHVGPRRSFEV
ncbi:hypothetical protein BGZ75_009518 [Mortierella antarctica]|nr:hypothetical protein BGZ75_009518 [Mortierella antarctica]